MRKLFFIAIIIAIMAAFFASTHPDGLDFVAEKFGFSEKGQGHQAPMPDYNLRFLPEGGVSTSLAGIAGIVIILGIFFAAAYFLKNERNNTTKNLTGIFIAMFLCLYVGVSHAARPLVTDDYYTVAHGCYELELGYSSTQNLASLANVTILSLKRGFLPNFDFGIEVPYTSSTPSGLNDMLLHAKYRFWDIGPDEGMTARVDFKLNNGSLAQGLGSGDYDSWLMWIYTKKFGEAKTHINLAYVNVGLNAGVQYDDYFAYTAAIEYPAWGEKGDIVAEYVANNTIYSPNPAFIQLGARYCFSSTFKIDAGYSFGLNDYAIKNSLTAGIHYEF